MQAALLAITELVPKHIRACISLIICDGTILNDDIFKEAIGRHVKYIEQIQIAIDPSVAAAGEKKAMAARNESTSIGRIQGQ